MRTASLLIAFASILATTASAQCIDNSFPDPNNPGACVQCPEGSVVNVDSTGCRQCDAGMGQVGNECAPCQPGTASRDGLCVGCTEGFFSEAASLSTCIACSPGKFSDYAEATTCASCAPGSYAKTSGLSSCITCSPGRFASGHESSTCIDCVAGRFAVSATECAACEVGRFSSPGSMYCARTEECTALPHNVFYYAPLDKFVTPTPTDSGVVLTVNDVDYFVAPHQHTFVRRSECTGEVPAPQPTGLTGGGDLARRR